jgi:hypothetical protein
MAKFPQSGCLLKPDREKADIEALSEKLFRFIFHLQLQPERIPKDIQLYAGSSD